MDWLADIRIWYGILGFIFERMGKVAVVVLSEVPSFA
jgi:hypothetical protein